MGTRLKDIIFDRHEDHLYEDERAMRLTPYVMAERCLQVEIKNIYKDYGKGDYETLTYILVNWSRMVNCRGRHTKTTLSIH